MSLCDARTFYQSCSRISHSKYKIPAYQQGHAYLTTHQACYIDDKDPRTNSVAIDLRDVDRSDLQVRVCSMDSIYQGEVRFSRLYFLLDG